MSIWIRIFCVCRQMYIWVHTHIHLQQTIKLEKLAVFLIKSICTINSHHNILHSIRHSIFLFRLIDSLCNLSAAMKILLHLWIRPLTGCITGLEIFYPLNVTWISLLCIDFAKLCWWTAESPKKEIHFKFLKNQYVLKNRRKGPDQHNRYNNIIM